MPQRILVFGATSAIAHAVSRRYAAAHASIVLVGRRADALEANAAICAFAARPTSAPPCSMLTTCRITPR